MGQQTVGRQSPGATGQIGMEIAAKVGAGRLHAHRHHFGRARPESAPDQGAVRPSQGLHADIVARRQPATAVRHHGHPREDRERIAGSGAREAGSAELRLAGVRRVEPHGLRDAEDDGQGEYRPRALQGHLARHHRRGGRPCAVHVQQHSRRARPHKGGKLRAIGHGGTKRSPALPDVPTIAETLPGFQVGTWYALAGPAGLPRPSSRGSTRR
jgi:hypothetical protein